VRYVPTGHLQTHREVPSPHDDATLDDGLSRAIPEPFALRIRIALLLVKFADDDRWNGEDDPVEAKFVVSVHLTVLLRQTGGP
jgi:hypothetical protein